jgi:DnaJ-class molecular chaperone
MIGGHEHGQPSPGTGTHRNPGDEESPTAPQTAENICRTCGGSGRADGGICPDCGGTGVVTETVGDA